eukprot:4128545-Amphidinium_carterae.2
MTRVLGDSTKQEHTFTDFTMKHMWEQKQIWLHVCCLGLTELGIMFQQKVCYCLEVHHLPVKKGSAFTLQGSDGTHDKTKPVERELQTCSQFCKTNKP